MADTKEESSAVDTAATEHQIAEHEAATARLKLERAQAEREVAKLREPMAAEEAAAQEAALAKLKLERATLERDIAKLTRPWWRSWNITALGAFLAAMAPLTAGVTGFFEKQKQLAIEAQKQDENIRGQYLDRLNFVEGRERVLRFISATSSDTRMQKWAGDELDHVNEAKSKLEHDLAELQQKQSEMDKSQAADNAQRQAMQQQIGELERRLRGPSLQVAPREEDVTAKRCQGLSITNGLGYDMCRVNCGDPPDAECAKKCDGDRAIAMLSGCYSRYGIAPPSK